MHQTAARPWIAAGVALAGAIAITPIAPPLPALPDLQSHAVQLTTGFDPFGAWEDVFSTANTNATTLWDNLSAAPMVAMQQAIYDLVKGVSIDPHAVIDAVMQPSMATDLPISPLTLSNDAFHTLITLLLPQMLPSDFPIPTDDLSPLLSFAASPLSGVLMGSLGPSISPLVALGNSISEISTDLSGATPDWSAALQDVANIPAHMVGGFLNGATLNLDALLPLITDQLPEGVTISSLSYTFGGLLSPGDTASSVYGFVKEISDGSATGIGGSILNGLGLNVNMGWPLDIPGVGIGPMGAWESLEQIIAGALGWDGVGNPLADLATTSTASAGTDMFTEMLSMVGL